MKYLFLFIIAFSPILVSAQTGTKKTTAPAQKTVFSTTSGNFRSATAPASFLKVLIDSALRVSDNKGNRYEVESFEFTHRHTKGAVCFQLGQPTSYCARGAMEQKQLQGYPSVPPENKRRFQKNHHQANRYRRLFFRKKRKTRVHKIQYPSPLDLDRIQRCGTP